MASIRHVRATEDNPNCSICLDPVLAAQDFYCCLGCRPFAMKRGKNVYRHAFHPICYKNFYNTRQNGYGCPLWCTYSQLPLNDLHNLNGKRKAFSNEIRYHIELAATLRLKANCPPDLYVRALGEFINVASSIREVTEPL